MRAVAASIVELKARHLINQVITTGYSCRGETVMGETHV